MVKKAKKNVQIKEVVAGAKASGGKPKAKKSKQNKVNFLKRTANFFKEMKSELKKVAWPTKKGVLNGTLTVFSMIAIVMLIVVSADFVFDHLIRLFLGIK